MSDDGFDAFISFSSVDREWVRALVLNLHNQNLDIFFDEWFLQPGDHIARSLENGITRARAGAIVLSAKTLSRPWVREEYNALVTRAVNDGIRIVPVLCDDCQLPPFLSSRLWINFSGADGQLYLDKVGELARTLRGEGGRPPPRTGAMVALPGSRVRPEGPLRRVLQIGLKQVKLLDGQRVLAQHEPARIQPRDEHLLWELHCARHRAASLSDCPTDSEGVGASCSRLHSASLAVGRTLGCRFLDGPAGETLAYAVAEATRLGVSLELGLYCSDAALEALPWETLCLPARLMSAGDAARDEVLVLHDRVSLFRTFDAGGAAAGVQVPGPLRILVVIGSPEKQNARGELLDMECELKTLLDAVDDVRRRGGAYVRILSCGTVRAIREALASQRFHVLHISCHATPGELVLEDDEGQEDCVSAERLWREALPPDRGVPLIVLAGCSTALDRIERRKATDGVAEVPSFGGAEESEGVSAEEADAQPLPGLARELLTHGVPAVIAMQASVGDVYATLLSGQLYHELAMGGHTEPLAALSAARRAVERIRCGRTKSAAAVGTGRLASVDLGEWATPSLYLQGPSLPLFDPTGPFEKITPAPEPRLAPGVCVRRVGDLVGRRREERLILQALRREQQPGMVLHGLGGVGKSTLVANVLGRLSQDGWLVLSVFGNQSADSLFDEIGRRLTSWCLEQGKDERDPWRQVAIMLRRPDIDWPERWDLLADHVLTTQPLVLLLDNFEDNLTADRTIRDVNLSGLLSAWIAQPGKSRLLVTCRHPLNGQPSADAALPHLHVGPLSLAETRKLVWRLPGLDAMGSEASERAYRDVGGHPRALEYLDALLRGGRARFDDVEKRLRRAVSKRIKNADAWFASHQERLDAAVAEAVTLAADDVLLDELLDRLEDCPLARQLLLAVSVYRVPVEDSALIWQVGKHRQRTAEDEAREERMHKIYQMIERAKAGGTYEGFDNLDLLAEEMQQHIVDEAEAQRPLVEAPAGFDHARALLLDSGLLAPFQPSDDEPLRYLVHRWTAANYECRAGSDQLRDAHARAGSYWSWRVKCVPQASQQDAADLLQARHHYIQGGQLELAVTATEHVCRQFHTWGAWRREEQLLRETLEWLDDRCEKRATFLSLLGNIACQRGDYDMAIEYYRESLQINEVLGDTVGMAASYHQFGNLAWLRRDYDGALDLYRKSLQIYEGLDNRAGMAGSYYQLGVIAHERRDHHVAVDWYCKSLHLQEEVGNHKKMAGCYYQLGLVAQERGDYDGALDWCRKSLGILEELGDRAGMAHCFQQAGSVAYVRGDYAAAMNWHRKAMLLFEELGHRAGLALSYRQLGLLAQEHSDYGAALDWYGKSLQVFEELGDPVGMANSYHHLGTIAQLRCEHELAIGWYRKSLQICEELGDRFGIACSYHHLGMVAHLRRDYVQAMDWYRKSMQLFDELGDRFGMASSLSQAGIALNEQGHPEEALPLILRSVAMRSQLGVPPVGVNLRWLARQREQLGAEHFRELLLEHLDDAFHQQVMKLIVDDDHGLWAVG